MPYFYQLTRMSHSDYSINQFLNVFAPMSRNEERKNGVPKIKLSNTNEIKEVNGELEAFRKQNKRDLKWTDEEVEALVKGVHKYGIGNWRMILLKYNDVFKGKRRIVDLATKYRLIKKDTSFYRTPKKDWIVIDDDGEPEIDSLGEIVVSKQKFPYDAAKKFAKKRIASGLRNFTIKIREAQDINNVHIYSVETSPVGTIKIKKMILRGENDD